jgi:hypothetical protein
VNKSAPLLSSPLPSCGVQPPKFGRAPQARAFAFSVSRSRQEAAQAAEQFFDPLKMLHLHIDFRNDLAYFHADSLAQSRNSGIEWNLVETV